MVKKTGRILFLLVIILNISYVLGGLMPGWESVADTARKEIGKCLEASASSAAIAVRIDGQTVYSESFGVCSLDTLRPVDGNTQFNIGSVSKVFAAASVLILVQQGKVNLDLPVFIYLPEFSMKDPRYKDITVRMLLNHTSGIAGTSLKDSMTAQRNAGYVQQVISNLKDSFLKNDPGEISIYCNDGFTLVQALVEKVSKISYSEFLAENIFSRLDMTNSSAFFKENNENIARYYDYDQNISFPAEYVNSLASGGLAGTAEDLVKYAEILYDDKILNEQLRKEFMSPQVGPKTALSGEPLYMFGLGWDSVEDPVFLDSGVTVLTKNGGTCFYSAQLHVVPEYKISVALTVAGGADVKSVNDAVLKEVLKLKGSLDESKKVFNIQTVLPLAFFSGYEGIYASLDSIFKYEIDLQNNGMNVEIFNGNMFIPYDFLRYEDGYFISRSSDVYSFVNDDNGKYIQQHFHDRQSTRVLIEKIKPSKNIDTREFENKVWVPLNLKAHDLCAMMARTGSISQADGYVFLHFSGFHINALKDGFTGENNLRYIRDTVAFRIDKTAGSCNLLFEGYRYADASILPVLERSEKIQIGSLGENISMRVSDDLFLKLDIPDEARLIIFSDSLEMIYDSLIHECREVYVPKGSYVTAIGKPGAEVGISLKKYQQDDRYREIKARAEKIADTLIDSYGVTSLQYAMIYNNEFILSSFAAGTDSRKEEVLSTATPYGIGSTSKMFTTAAVMYLVDKGLVDLDKPVSEYIPQFTMKDERYKQITVRMLLNHSSGFMGSVYAQGPTYNHPDTANHDNILKELSGQMLKADPGAFSVYCNDGFTLAELVVENISKMSFTQFVRLFIIDPLKLQSTFTPQDSFEKSRLAATFVNGIRTPGETFNMIGTGGMYSTAEDLCRFGQIFMDNSGYSPAGLILSQKTKDETFSKEYSKGVWPVQTDNIAGFGLGWDSVDLYPYNRHSILAVSKGGDTGLYHSSLVVLAEYNIAFAVTFSGGSSTFGSIFAQEIILDLLQSEGKVDRLLERDKKTPVVLAAMPLYMTEYSGSYENSENIYDIQISTDGVLTEKTLYPKGIPEQKYKYTKEGFFVNAAGNKKLSFVKEKNGITYICTEKNMFLNGLGRVKAKTYSSQKTYFSDVEESIRKVWEERTGNKYFLVNEQSTSQNYHQLAASSMSFSMDSALKGCISNYRIISRDFAVVNVQIPGFDGRDTQSIQVFEKDGKEYIKNAGWIFLCDKNIDYLNGSETGSCIIGTDGYACWYKIPDDKAGKSIEVSKQGGSSFAVYDENSCIFYSVVSGNQKIMLPKNGMILFIGEKPGDVLYYSIK